MSRRNKKISIDAEHLKKDEMQEIVEVVHDFFRILGRMSDCVQVVSVKVQGIMHRGCPLIDGIFYRAIFDQPGAADGIAEVTAEHPRGEKGEAIALALARGLAERKLEYAQAQLKSVIDTLDNEVEPLEGLFAQGAHYLGLPLRNTIDRLHLSTNRALKVLLAPVRA